MHRIDANLDQLMKVYRTEGWIPNPPQRNGNQVTVQFKCPTKPGTYSVKCIWKVRTSPITAKVTDVDFTVIH